MQWLRVRCGLTGGWGRTGRGRLQWGYPWSGCGSDTASSAAATPAGLPERSCESCCEPCNKRKNTVTEFVFVILIVCLYSTPGKRMMRVSATHILYIYSHLCTYVLYDIMEGGGGGGLNGNRKKSNLVFYASQQQKSKTLSCHIFFFF